MQEGNREIGSPQEKFGDELYDLLKRWKDKPADDRINVAEAVGTVFLTVMRLSREIWDEEG